MTIMVGYKGNENLTRIGPTLKCNDPRFKEKYGEEIWCSPPHLYRTMLKVAIFVNNELKEDCEFCME